jgi:hypothetical protein
VATPPAEESLELFRLLRDLQWHDFTDIKNAVAAKVAPGRAYRKYMEDLRSRRRQMGDPNYEPPHSESTRIELGARRQAQSVISGWSGKGVEIEKRDGRRWIRVKPGFRSLGIPGFEPDPPAGGQDPDLKGAGAPEVPPAESEPSEADGERVLEEPRSRRGLADFVSKALTTSEPVTAMVQDGEPEPEAVVAPEPEVVAPEPEAIFAPEPEAVVAPEPETAPEAEPVEVHAASGSAWPELTDERPGSCPDCGSSVLDWGVHDAWHRDYVKRSEQSDMALLNESQLRSLLTSVMGQHLDRFQEGMQSYLDQAFVQVNSNLLQILTQARAGEPRPVWRS